MMKKLIAALSVATLVGVACPITASAEEEHEAMLKASDVPAAAQKAVEAEAKGGKIVRWEKEGKNYEGVVEKNGKQTGVEVDASGKILSRHNESKEHKEKGEKY